MPDIVERAGSATAPDGSSTMNWKMLAATCSGILIIVGVGAVTLTRTPGESGPSLSNSTATTSTTTPASATPRSPGYMGGY